MLTERTDYKKQRVCYSFQTTSDSIFIQDGFIKFLNEVSALLVVNNVQLLPVSNTKVTFFELLSISNISS